MKEEIFTVNDIVIYQNTKYTISNFSIIDNKMYVILIGISVPISIKEIQEVKDPMFTTEDGIDIYKGDSVYGVSTGFTGVFECDDLKKAKKERWLKFSTEEKAREHLLMNKPCLSLKDIQNFDNLTYHYIKVGRDRLEELVKSKINS